MGQVKIKPFKKYCFIVCLGILLAFTGKGQEIKKDTPDVENARKSPFHWQGLLQEEGMDYRAVMKQTSEFFRQNPEQKEKQEETYKSFIRWKLFWENRMTKEGHSKTGPWYAHEMLERLYSRATASRKKKDGFNSICKSQEFNPQWQFLGPKRQFNKQNRGRIECVKVHPNDTNTIDVGSCLSGLQCKWALSTGAIGTAPKTNL